MRSLPPAGHPMRSPFAHPRPAGEAVNPGTLRGPVPRRIRPRTRDEDYAQGETMKPVRVRLMSFLMASMFVAGPVAAQALDVPVVSPLQSKPGSVRLMVSAGVSGAPAGFTIERMTKLQFDAQGGWDGEAAPIVRSEERRVG